MFEIKRRVMDLIYIVDTSGSMNSGNISDVRVALTQSLNDISKMDEINDDVEIKVSLITFANKAGIQVDRQSLKNAMESTNQYFKEKPEGENTTSYISALNKLKDHFNNIATSGDNLLAPVIIFVSDGYDLKYLQDGGHQLTNYIKDLNQSCNMFKEASKVAIGIKDTEDSALVEPLACVVGDERLVVETINTTLLSNIIRIVSISASQINSQISKAHATVDDTNPNLNINQIGIVETLEKFKANGDLNLNQLKPISDEEFAGW